MNAPTARHWISCQIGSREHYAIPRALYQQGRLACLLTDIWAPSRPPLTWLSLLNTKRKLTNRYHPDLAGAPIEDFTWACLAHSVVQKIRREKGWWRMVSQDAWFRRQFARALACLDERAFAPGGSFSGERPIVFSYSYAALETLRYAKARGWPTVLGQIDPGLVEEDLVTEEHLREPSLGRSWSRIPTQRWDAWREELALADIVMVNSAWSFEALRKVDVPAAKLRVVPLAYEESAPAAAAKEYPVAFTAQRPMRVLFLGQITLRKGVARLLRAAQRLPEQIELWLVGPRYFDDDPDLTRNPRIRWVGAIDPSEANHYYHQADVFILPTLSDGFALTQLEAMAHRLPLIVSKNCGDVVRDGVDGLVLPDVSAESIEAALLYCVAHPEKLAAYSAAAGVREEFSLNALAANLLALERSL